MTSAFAPGCVTLLGEHGGLALAFTVAQGVTVTAVFETAVPVEPLLAAALDEFAALDTGLEVVSELPDMDGLSAATATCVASALALGADSSDVLALAQRCRAVEQRAAGVETGLGDPLAVLCGRPGEATLIDFKRAAVGQVPLALEGYQLVLVDAGPRGRQARRADAKRRAECAEACQLLGVEALSDAPSAGTLPAPLGRRVRHVLSEDLRVRAAADALGRGDLAALGPLLDASHASLRDDFEVSTERVEQVITELKAAGALGARLSGGAVLALF
ncbi:MAG: hypothetical protein J2O48_09860, partial [Solirubrobacterales bacterium]|nr:hypothetical protein [Solirubrobacterales bacterium]